MTNDRSMEGAFNLSHQLIKGYFTLEKTTPRRIDRTHVYGRQRRSNRRPTGRGRMHGQHCSTLRRACNTSTCAEEQTSKPEVSRRCTCVLPGEVAPSPTISHVARMHCTRNKAWPRPERPPPCWGVSSRARSVDDHAAVMQILLSITHTYSSSLTNDHVVSDQLSVSQPQHVRQGGLGPPSPEE